MNARKVGLAIVVAMMFALGGVAVAHPTPGTAHPNDTLGPAAPAQSTSTSHPNNGDPGARPCGCEYDWRPVTHYRCGWTGIYYVMIGAPNFLYCTGCGCPFRAYIPF